MKTSKVTLAIAMVVVLASTASARVLLQDGRPSQCDANTGSWDDDDFDCDFTCNNNGWELDCETDDSNEVECKLDQDGAPDSEDIKFTCSITSPGQAADCGDFSALNAVSDTCVQDTVKAVLAAWKPVDGDDDDDDDDDNDD